MFETTPTCRTTGCGCRTTVWMVSALLLITLLGAALRVHFLNHPMRYDEAFNFLMYSSRSPEHIVTHYAPNNHVLHSLCVRVGSHWLGTSPAALRVPALLAGVTLVPLSALLAWRLFANRWAAVLAALMVAASSQMVEYSANSRGYSLMTVFAVLAFLCTLQILENPGRRRWWLAWAVAGAAGAFTMPTMLYPFMGTAATLAIAALRPNAAGPRRRALLRGLALGISITGALTLLAYAPALVAQGLAATWETRRQTYDVWNPVVGSRAGMLGEMWAGWTRHAGPAWATVLALGLGSYAVRLVREPSVRRALPVIVFVVSAAAVLCQGVLLRDRAWMFALPLCFACAAEGALRLVPKAMPVIPAAGARAAAAIVVALVTVNLATRVQHQRFLCSEPNVAVDIEEIVAECDGFGTHRCGLVMRYTPALGYYLQRQKLAAPQAPAEADRVYIVVDDVRSLDEQWHEGVEGYDRFTEPRMLRRLARCTLFVADRADASSPETVAAGK